LLAALEKIGGGFFVKAASFSMPVFSAPASLPVALMASA
jgi:hypothetical protein